MIEIRYKQTDLTEHQTGIKYVDEKLPQTHNCKAYIDPTLLYNY